MRSMATRWSVRRVNGIHAYRSAEKSGEWLTMSEAAAALGVTHHRIRRLIKDGILRGECGVLRTKSEPPICNTNGWPPRSSEQVARVASITKINLQCLQILDEGGTMSASSLLAAMNGPNDRQHIGGEVIGRGAGSPHARCSRFRGSRIPSLTPC